MTCTIRSFCLGATLCTVASIAQVAFTQNPSSAVAYVYVSNALTDTTSEVHAFAAAKNGKLRPIDGSPFAADLGSMALTATHLFGASSNGLYVDAYTIEPGGSLRYDAATDIVKNNFNGCGFSGPIFLDHTGATLYDMEFRGDCSNNNYQSFNLNKSNGQMQNLGSSGASSWLYLPAAFIGNNVYAYTASCLGDMYWAIFSFKREGNGMLTEINANAAPPTPPTGYFYCPSLAAADPTNHVAITMQPVNQTDFNPDRPAQLASYTADSAGNLITTNTNANMPSTLVGTINDIKMSPSGKLLAVGGSAGLQVFHFNGAQPITHFTGLLTNKSIDQFFWDNHNHLYAISNAAGKLFVFTVTPFDSKHAPGSPYSINRPHNIIVQPYPRN